MCPVTAARRLLGLVVLVRHHEMVSNFTSGLVLDHALAHIFVTLGELALHVRDLVWQQDHLRDELLATHELNDQRGQTIWYGTNPAGGYGTAVVRVAGRGSPKRPPGVVSITHTAFAARRRGSSGMPGTSPVPIRSVCG